MAVDNILSVKEFSLVLHEKRRAVRLVNQVGFSLQRNKVMGLIGESGCGKSLTCLGIMGMLPNNIEVEQGEVTLCGRAFLDMKLAEKTAFRGKAAAMILQNPMSCFDSVFKIRHHFFETLMSHGEKKTERLLESSRKALWEVGFENPDEILDLYPFQMSGGMLQRVMVALALMMRVSLLIADEPTTDLDVVSQGRILDLLGEMRDNHGMSILLVTHDLSVIAKIADDLVVMKEGQVVESGPIKIIFQESRHPYTQSLLKAHFSMYDTKLQNLLNRTAPVPKAGETIR